MTNALDDLLHQLAEIAQAGPVEAQGAGTKSVGSTLANLLGLRAEGGGKLAYRGIVISARRRTSADTRANRVNLFARVPDWRSSTCKSSKEILEKYGYFGKEGERRLYCTVDARSKNSQGLFLSVDQQSRQLLERAEREGAVMHVATWRLEDLEQTLIRTHPASVWVSANVVKQAGKELLHYRFATYSGSPKPCRLAALLAAGTVTVDHLIGEKCGRVTEKGPLFKIKPGNIPALFEGVASYDLMEM